MHTHRPSAPIAIVGAGCRFAGAWDLHAYAEQMMAGADGFGPIPADRWRHDGFFDQSPRKADKAYTARGGFIEDIKSFPAVSLQIPPRRLEVMDPQQRLILEVALQAVADAGMTKADLPKRTGVYVGVTAVEFRTLMASRILAQMMAQGDLGEGMADPSALAAAVDRVLPPRPFTAPGVLSNMIAATVAQELRLKGPAFTMDAACASSLLSVAQAVAGLRSGQVDVALAGGVYLCLTPEHHVAFSRIGAISPSGRCLPFDARADGFVQGDGGGVVVLKRLDDAVAAGDRVYAILDGIAVNNDGGGEGPMAPVKSGQVDVIQMAWADAGFTVDGAVQGVEALGYVETHGTGTGVGDKTELSALVEVLGPGVREAALGSAKANVGHTMSAAGVAGLIRACLALHRGVVPPMAHFESAKPDLGLAESPFYIPTAPAPWAGPRRLAAVSSFGFGGTNVHAVLRAPEAPASAPAIAPEITPEITGAPQLELIQMSAPDEASLRALAGRTADAVAADAAITVAGVARAWQIRRQQPARLAVIADTRDSLIERLRAVAAGEHIDGAVIGAAEEDADPKIAFLYPGQGAQQVGMLRALKARFPIIAEALAAADAARPGKPITPLLYPEVEDEAAQRTLTDTQNAQPALLAVGQALTALLTAAGVSPAVVAGHSVGEFTAAVTAGVLPFSAGMRWVGARGEAMSGHEGDPGAMVAIHASAEDAEALLRPGAVIANHNHPRQVVISGYTEAVQAVTEAAQAAGLRATPLQVSHGFHSPVFDDLDLAGVVDALPLAAPSVPVASCIQAHPYGDAEEARAVFKAHATSPVRWVDTLRQCAEAGADLYLQVGVGGPLAAFARGTLAPDSHKGVLTLSSHKEDQSISALLITLGKLWIAGAPVDMGALTGGAAVASVPPEILPRSVHWGVRETGTGRTELIGLSGEAAQATTQTAALKVAQPAPKAAQPAPKAAPQQPAEAAAKGVDDIILDTVAQVSAYPRAALKPQMRLMEDLGFDSLMLVDLGEQLVKAIAPLDGLPQELFVNQPQIQTLIDYVAGVAASPSDASPSDASPSAGDAADDDAPLQRLTPHWQRRDLPQGLAGAQWPADLKVAVAGPGDLTGPLSVAVGQWGSAVVLPAEADLLLWAADGPHHPHPDLVLEGRAEAPDPARRLIELLATLDQQGRRPSLLIVRDEADPWVEALNGVVKSLAREWPDARCQVIAFAEEIGIEQRLHHVAHAWLSDDGAPEALITEEGRFVSELLLAPTREADFTPGRSGWTVITGGMRSVGLALASHLLDAGGMVILVGRRGPSSEAEDLWHRHGDRVAFVQADVLDRQGIIGGLAPWADRIHTLIHSAGLLADGAVGEVSAEDGAQVRAVKGRGWLNAVAACGRGLRRTLALGSWAGRFGNRHQIHYAAANAQMAALAEFMPVPAVVSEFGPWVDSTMGHTLPEAVKSAMRRSGVDFVGTAAGVQAIMADLGDPIGISLRARRVPAAPRRGKLRVELSVADHPYLKDHAIGGVPVMPMAAVADLVAEAAGYSAPFEIQDLRLFRGLTVEAPKALTVEIEGEAAKVKGADEALYYTAKVRPTGDRPTWIPVEARGAAAITLQGFYDEITFHGPMLQGVVAVDGVGDQVIRGRVKTSAPSDWVVRSDRARWAVDPLALDSAFQLAAVAAWTRFKRGGTPIGFGRLVQLAPLPDGDVWAEVRMTAHEGDRFIADVALLDAAGDLLLLVSDLQAELKTIEGVTPAVAAQGAPAQAAETEAEAGAGAGADDPMAGFSVKPEWVDFGQIQAYQDLKMRLEMVEALGLKNPYFDVHQGTARSHSLIDGRDCLNYSSYNYLGYSGDPRVLDAVEAAMRTYGTSVSASRVASGERPFHGELERSLAAAQGAEAALVMGSGHATNVMTIGHLFGPKDLILHDELIHDSCLQGIKLSGAARRSFRHEDADHLEAQLKVLRPHYERVLILTEGVYSMDGDISNTPAFVALKRKYACLLMVDEAHSFGTVGATGRGVCEHWGLKPGDVDILMGTMSKTLSAMGGWIAGTQALVEYLRYTSPGFVFAAGLPPTLGVAALTSLQLMAQEPERVRALQRNSKTFVEALIAQGMDVGPAKGESPVVPVITGNSLHAMHLSARLLDDGINARPIVYPAVADDAARLRFFLCTLHTEAELVHTAARVAHHLNAIRSELG